MSAVQEGSRVPGDPLNVVIIGGSLTGLMHGLVFKRLGHNVRILERSLSSEMDGQGAGITIGPQLQEFLDKFDAYESPSAYCVASTGVKILKDSKVRLYRKIPLYNTSWQILYSQLRANYDGSRHAPANPPRQPIVQGENKVEYRHGVRVTNIMKANGSIVVEFEDLLRGSQGQICADMVLAANGANSNIRSLLLPESYLQRPFAGYLAWRGLVFENDLSEDTRTALGTENSLYIMAQSYVVVYMIPGPDGSTEPGSRSINFVWYRNCDKDALCDILTDVNGHLHRHSVPMGSLRTEVWARQRAVAQGTLPSPFLEVLQKIDVPFVTVVSETSAPNASFFDGKVLLVGDALTLFRPHIALSTNQGAFQALLLRRVLEGQLTMEDWETQVMQYARRGRLRSISWGAYFQVGWAAYFASELSLRWELLLQWSINRWYGRESQVYSYF